MDNKDVLKAYKNDLNISEEKDVILIELCNLIKEVPKEKVDEY